MNKIRGFLFGKGSNYAYAACSLLLTIIPEDIFLFFKFNSNWPDSTIVLINRILFCMALFFLGKIFYSLYRKNRKKVIIKGSGFVIQVEYCDITKVNEGKRVIHFDECFTTTVGEKPGDIKKESVCGQYLENHKDIKIKKLIGTAGVKPKTEKSLYKNRECYEPGTIVPNGDDLLMAFAKLDQNGRALMTYEEYIRCLDKLWEQIDIYHGTKDVYVPVLGSFITRFDKNLTQQELLDIMVCSYSLYPHKLNEPNKLHIVCVCRKGFSLNSIIGVE